jgi:hypothetical protein
MPFLELFDETLDINSTEKYEMSLLISPDELSYCLLDTLRNKMVMIRSFGADDKPFNAGNISELIRKDDFLTKQFRKVNCAIPGLKYTLVPSPLYDPGKKVQYFTFNHNLPDDSLVLTNKIADPDAYLVFSVPKPFLDAVTSFYPFAQVFHHIKLLLDHASTFRKYVNGNYISLHVERDYFNLSVFRENKLEFCNSFTYRNISDIMYFVLNTYKKLSIRNDDTIWFSGMTERYGDLSSSMTQYIRNIKFAEPSGTYTFSYVFNDAELHRFLNLFTLANCG